jgi:hypothetical protein
MTSHKTPLGWLFALTLLWLACGPESQGVLDPADSPQDLPADETLAQDENEVTSCGETLALVRATASANDGNVPANAIDNNLTTRWSALGKGQTLTVDLGAAKPLCGVSVAWYRGSSRRVSFRLATSADGTDYAEVYSGTSSGTTANAESYLLQSGASGRYVRITVLGNTENDWASVSEVTTRTTGTSVPTPVPTPTASGGAAPDFDGSSGYVQIGDNDAYSHATFGGLSVEAWIRPDSLSMPRRESGGYVHWMGKGVAGAHEWTTRMYQEGNTEGRANRISAYHFNPEGGLGAGSYFQDAVTVGQWIHVVATIDGTTIRIYKNGVLRDSDALSGYNITPRNTSSPLRIGTRDFNSFFQGAIARVAIYKGALPVARIQAHYASRGSATTYDSVVLSEASVVGFWRLNETSGTAAVDATGRQNGTYVGGAGVGRASWTP